MAGMHLFRVEFFLPKLRKYCCRMEVNCKILSSGLCFGLALSVVSCNDDQALLEKSRKQKAEISRLQGEIAHVEAQLKQVPDDRSKELMGAETSLKALTQEMNQLDAEVAELERQKDSLEKEFAEYKTKYPIN